MSAKNKKGQMLISGIIIAVVIGIVILLMISGGVAGGTLDSLEPKQEDCDAPNTNVRLKGIANVKDNAWLGVKAVTDSLEIKEVRNIDTGAFLGTFQLKGFTSQDYKWKVELINTRTNNVEASDKGSNNHPGGSIVQENPFTLDFKVPENNCDGQIDDFDGKLEFTVVTDDNEISTIRKDLMFRNGRFRKD